MVTVHAPAGTVTLLLKVADAPGANDAVVNTVVLEAGRSLTTTTLINVVSPELLTEPLYVRAYFISVRNALTATVLCLITGYPMALGITRVSRSWRNILLMLVILPFWTSFLLRVYAWMGLMGSNSWFNHGLTAIYNAMAPADWQLTSIPMMNTNFAVVLVMVYSYLPFMILPLYANLEKLDTTLNEAAMDLGSRPSGPG